MNPDEALQLLWDEFDHYTEAVGAVRDEVTQLRARQAELLRLCDQRERNSGGHLPYVDTSDIREILGGAS